MQGYPPQGQYPRGGYGGYGMARGGYAPPNPMAYGQYPAPAYGQGYAAYQQYPGPMYGAPQGYPGMGFPAGRGRGMGYYPPAGRGGAGFRGGAAYRGGRGGVRAYRKKKPFVGGSLESQKEWERETACCFYKQGKCKFGENCRFLHEENSDRPCQFGDKCRVHGTGGSSESGSKSSTPAAENQKEEKKEEAKEEKKDDTKPAEAKE